MPKRGATLHRCEILRHAAGHDTTAVALLVLHDHNANVVGLAAARKASTNKMKKNKWPKTNLQILKPSSKRPAVGDFFVANMLGKKWILGRVIDDQCKMFSGDGELLLYFFKRSIASPETPTQSPIMPDLLISPIIVDWRAWIMGVFHTIASRAFLPGEVLEQHFFYEEYSADCARFTCRYL